MAEPKALAYTFGNHMHWVDMQWLWGSQVLPGSVRDMVAFCQATGAKGCVNFDGVGYEKLAAEAPESLAELRRAVQEGTIEPVGASYGQPYGLFNGGESNIRQRIYGIRACMTLLGVRPTTFWEEEFDFFPQLPQMLRGCGYEGASLFFQWTWHTPEAPMEEAPAILWEGVDGTRIPAATRNRLNLHQWPEDFRILLDQLAAEPPSDSAAVPPLIQQWLELMPSPDWMCRSELMIPMLLELKNDPRFSVEMTTLGGWLKRQAADALPVRRYRLDDVWHGMTLGKNFDAHPESSALLEKDILAAETASAVLSLFGRPYQPWDVYPTWELEEAWRALLVFQHHDNHECEGLCGHVAAAQRSYAWSILSSQSPLERLGNRLVLQEEQSFAFNGAGFAREMKGGAVPALGYAVLAPAEFAAPNPIEIDAATGRLLSLGGIRFRPDFDWPRVSWRQDGQKVESGCKLEKYERGTARFKAIHLPELAIEVSDEGGSDGIRIEFSILGDGLPIDPGFEGALRLHWPFPEYLSEVWADSPYAIEKVGAGSRGRRKYPLGDWMTSPQWFEEVEGAFTSLSLVNMVGSGGSGLLVTHSGARQWFRREDRLETVIGAVDPWDGGQAREGFPSPLWVHTHTGLSPYECAALAAPSPRKITRWGGQPKPPFTEGPPLPRRFTAVHVDSPSIAATAFYREEEAAGRRLSRYAGAGMGHPFILRLVEFNGEPAEALITLAGPIASAWKANLLGEPIQELHASPGDPALLTGEPDLLAPFGISASQIRLALRPREIATLYLDLVPGRKQFRDLDAKREIWATVHRTPDQE